MCRFYLPPEYGDSHFYSATPTECAEVAQKFPGFAYESAEVFRVDMPDLETGQCPQDMVPVYRLWNNRVDSNHGYTADRLTRDQMVAKGYVVEGYGADPVIMCGCAVAFGFCCDPALAAGSSPGRAIAVVRKLLAVRSVCVR